MDSVSKSIVPSGSMISIALLFREFTLINDLAKNYTGRNFNRIDSMHEFIFKDFIGYYSFCVFK